MSLVFLDPGLVIDSIGAERTIATIYTDYPFPPNCDGAEFIVDGLAANPNQVINNCDTSQDIEAIDTEIVEDAGCFEVVLLNADTCTEGATLAPGESCTTDMYNTVDYFCP